MMRVFAAVLLIIVVPDIVVLGQFVGAPDPVISIPK